MGEAGGKFNVADAMVLVAATALGFAWARASQRAHEAWLSAIGPILAFSAMPRSTLEATWAWLEGYLPCVATWMPALVILSWRQPHAAHPRLTTRAGVRACDAASQVLGLDVARA